MKQYSTPCGNSAHQVVALTGRLIAIFKHDQQSVREFTKEAKLRVRGKFYDGELLSQVSVYKDLR